MDTGPLVLPKVWKVESPTRQGWLPRLGRYNLDRSEELSHSNDSPAGRRLPPVRVVTSTETSPQGSETTDSVGAATQIDQWQVVPILAW